MESTFNAIKLFKVMVSQLSSSFSLQYAYTLFVTFLQQKSPKHLE